MKPRYFASAAEFRRWLELHHATATELLVGFYKKGSGLGGMTYPEALDEALCFGWIDGLRKNAGPESYTIRFTPRRAGSIWSNVNVKHVERLQKAGRMRAAGLKAYAGREARKTGVYTFERPPATFPPELERIFRRNRAAWRYWEGQPPGYRRTVTGWVTQAKKPETQQRRLAALVQECEAGRRIDFMHLPRIAKDK